MTRYCARVWLLNDKVKLIDCSTATQREIEIINTENSATRFGLNVLAVERFEKVGNAPQECAARGGA